MHDRIDFETHSAQGNAAVNRLYGYVSTALDPVLLNLVFLRASQINGCAYCTDSHSVDLAKADGDVRRVYSVAAWRESTLYTDAERAALALTEAATRLPDGFDEAVLDAAREHFDDKQISDLVLAIGMINLWNVMGVTASMSPPPLAART